MRNRKEARPAQHEVRALGGRRGRAGQNDCAPPPSRRNRFVTSSPRSLDDNPSPRAGAAIGLAQPLLQLAMDD
jgi:hypothetical protein